MPRTRSTRAEVESPTLSLVRSTLTVIGLVFACFASLWLLSKVTRILTWLVIAGFFSVVLHPALGFFERRLHLKRTLAAFVVFVIGMAAFGGMIYLFVRPIVDQSTQFVNNFPKFVEDAKAGRGNIGRLVKHYKIDDYVARNQEKLRQFGQDAGKPALKIAQSVVSGLAALVTIMVLTFLMLLEGPRMLAGGVGMLSPPRAERLKRVGADAARAVTGYVAGNLLISLIAGFVTYVALRVLSVPFPEVLALWVAFADLIPLVGATLGAIPTIAIAFLHSNTAGIVMIIVFVAYQQFENHVLQVTIMSRTVKLSPLTVLVSVLAGVELFGFLGALLAIPAAGVIQVVARDIYDEHQGRIRPEPTIGEDEVPVSQVIAKEAAEQARDDREAHDEDRDDREAS
jgi:predicted PurR-regulated permease PerM